MYSAAIWSDLNQVYIFSRDFGKTIFTYISQWKRIKRELGSSVLAERHEEVDSRFWQFCGLEFLKLKSAAQ